MVIITDELISVVSRILGRDIILGEFCFRHPGEPGWQVLADEVEKLLWGAGEYEGRQESVLQEKKAAVKC
jgi:hypothetical protein